MDLPVFTTEMTLEGQMRESIRRTNRNSKGLVDQFLYHLENVSVEYGNCKALDSVNLAVNPGEILFITGRSGAGKTTLLNILASDAEPTRGQALSTVGNGRFVAQVFQDLRLFENKTCEENLWYSYDSKIYKNKNEFQSDMNELTQVLGVKDKLNIRMSDANGGLKQKIAMIRALLTRPNVLLADEPTASLDKDSSMKLFDILNFYNVKRKMTIIWASHNRDLVKQFPGKIVHLENGKLIYSGHACFI
jgi:ABC-type multidrug transport system ATPase subunit